MAPVAGEPFLWYLLKDLSKYKEINRIILYVWYLREVIFEWIDQVKDEFCFEFVYAVEEQPLETGGTRLALSKAKTNDVVVLNGDIYFAINLCELMEAHRLYPSTVTLALKLMQDFKRYGRVIIHEVDKRIIEFKEKEYCQEGLINGGIYVINK